MSSPTDQEVMDKCPIDGNYFVPKAGKKVCSPKCKRLWDSQQRRQRNLAIKLEAEREQATAEANKEAANDRRRRQRAEKKAQAEAAKRVQYETPEEAAKWEQPQFTRAQIIFIIILVVGVFMLILGLPNGS